MEILINKWKDFTAYKKLKKLWNEYRKVSHLKDQEETLKKFNSFLDYCKNYIVEMIQRSGNQNQIEAIFGECTDVLNSLLEYLNNYITDQKNKNNAPLSKNEQLDSVLEKVLEIAEFILRDPKYKKHIENSSKILNDFLSLIEKVENNESKVIIIKTIILIAENNDIKMEFAQKEGFKKILTLLMSKEEKIYQVISKALIHFLSAEKAINPESIDEEDQKKLSSVSAKLFKIASDFRKFTISEIQRSFDSKTKSIKKDSGEKTEKDEKLHVFDDASAIELNQLPNYSMIFEFDLLLLLKEMHEAKENPMLEEEKKNNEEALTFSQENEEKNLKIEELLKAFMISQGGFKSILNALSEANSSIQIEFLKTLDRLISHNAKNKNEFKKLNGYNFLAEFFITERDYTSPEKIEYLLSIFDLLESMICENKTDLISNYDAFQVLLTIIAKSSQAILISKSLDLLKFLFVKSWKNIIIATRYRTIDNLILLLLRIFPVPGVQVDSEQLNMHDLENSEILTNSPLLEKVDSLLKTITYVNGAYNLDAELYFGEIALSSILQNSPFKNYFLSFFLELLNQKKNRKCARVFMMEYKVDRLVKCFAGIFGVLREEKGGGGELEKMIEIMSRFFEEKLLNFWIDSFIICDHKADILEEASNNAFLDFIFEKELKEIERPDFDRKNIEQKLICKNICVEVKETIRTYLKEKILSFSDFSILFNLLKDDVGSASVDLNIEVLQTFSSIFLMDEYFPQLFQKKDVSSMLSHLMTYTNCAGTNFNNYFSLTLNLLLGKVNASAQLLSFSLKHVDIPTIDFKRLSFFNTLGFLLIKSSLTEENASSLEQFLVFLSSPENYRQFSSSLGISYILELLQKVETQHNSLYVNSLAIFEILIEKLSGEELELYFSYYFNTLTLKKCEKNEFSTLIDTLSLIAIHLVFNTNNSLVEKIMSQEHFFLLFSFLATNNFGVKDMTLKLLALLHLQSMKRKNNFFTKNKFFALLLKLLTTNSNQNNEFCQTIYHLISWNGEKISLLYPPNSSAVSSIVNRGSVADLVVKASKNEADKSINGSMANLEFVEIFFGVIRGNEDENFRYEMLRMMELELNDANCDKLLESNFLLWCQNFCKGLENTKSEFQVHQIITKLFFYDLYKQKSARFLDNLRKIFDDDSFIVVVLRNMIVKLCENPVLKSIEANSNSIFLKNLTILFNSIEELVGINANLMILIMQCINILASKNTGELRSQMKALGLFELRDNLLMLILKYEIKTEKFHKILEGFSFENLANQNKFKESHSLAYLLKILTDKSNSSALQLLIIKILKNDVAANEENQKYIAKLLENPRLILFFFPNYAKNKLSGVAKCFNSINPFVDNEEFKDLSDDEDDTETAKKNKTPKIISEMTDSEFLDLWISEDYAYERRQVQLRIERILIPVITENSKQESKLFSKINSRKNKLIEENNKEKLKIQKIVNEYELKMSQKLGKAGEKYKIRHLKNEEMVEGKLREGELFFEKMRKSSLDLEDQQEKSIN